MGKQEITSEVKFDFKCEKCDGTNLVETLVNAVIHTDVRGFDMDKDGTLFGLDYGEQSNEYGEVDRFQCGDCGFVLEGITEAEELYFYMNPEGQNA